MVVNKQSSQTFSNLFVERRTYTQSTAQFAWPQLYVPGIEIPNDRFSWFANLLFTVSIHCDMLLALLRPGNLQQKQFSFVLEKRQVGPCPAVWAQGPSLARDQ